MKDDLRRHMRAARAEVTSSEWAAAAEAVQRRVQVLEALRRATVVSCYLSLTNELPTGGIIYGCHLEGRAVCVPVWDAEAERYAFAALVPGARLREGRMHVLEPEEVRWVPDSSVDLFLVPGLAFDAHGGRLGYGSGYYDNLLSRARKDAVRVGLAADWQVVEKVPMLAHDQRMDWILTEARAICCRRRT